MFTTALELLGGGAALLSPAVAYAGVRMRIRRAELADLHDRLEQREAREVALWDYVLQLRYWMVKGQEGDPPTMPDTLTIAAVRARVTA